MILRIYNKIYDIIKFNILSIFGNQDKLAISRRYVASTSLSTEVAYNIVGGNFFNGLMLLMKADDAFMGLITMVALVANLLQVFSAVLLNRIKKMKKFLIIGRCLLHLFNIVIIGIIPYLPVANKSKLTAVLIAILCFNLVNAVIAPGFSVWHIKFIPQKIRAKYYSFYRMTIGIILYSAILLASAFVDYFKVSGNELMGLSILRIIAVILVVIDIYLMTKLDEYFNESTAGFTSIKDVLVSPFREKKYLITVIIACLWSFSANAPGPFYSIYLLKDLHVSYSYLNIINMLNIPIVILTTPIWAKIIDHTTWFKTLCISMGFFALHYIGLSAVTENTLILYPISVIYAFTMASGINLVFSNIPYINIPEKNQTNAIGFYSSMNNLAALISVTLSRELIRKTENISINVLGITMQNKQYIMLITAVLMLIAVAWIFFLQKKVFEPGEGN